MSEVATFQSETRAYSVMQNKLGEQGMSLLDAQLDIWQELNDKELESPLRSALMAGDTTLPEGTLLHSIGGFDEEKIQGISKLGIVSGELIGHVEDSETNGCADFFRVAEQTDIGSYVSFCRERVLIGRLNAPRGERLIAQGVTFIVDPNAEGMSELLDRDGYRDPEMQSFINPPTKRSESDTAAILGGVPKGSIAGVIISDRVAKNVDDVETLKTTFPLLPIFSHAGDRI